MNILKERNQNDSPERAKPASQTPPGKRRSALPQSYAEVRDRSLVWGRCLQQRRHLMQQRE